MKKETRTAVMEELEQLCRSVRQFVADGALDHCWELVCQAMERHPHAPQPHNLLGILLEKTGDHPTAMKHFRAAWALDPTYQPANHNLQTYGTFYSGGRCAYDESDLPTASARKLSVQYDARGIGRIVGKTKIEYDARGIGHVVRR